MKSITLSLIFNLISSVFIGDSFHVAGGDSMREAVQ